jgi:RimJ/RimL family protein N-acetyltransferase
MLSLRLTDDAELGALEPWHADEFAAHVAAAEEHLGRWLPWGRTANNRDGALAILQRYADSQAHGGGRIFGIWVDGKLAGGTLFRTWDEKQAVCEVGVWLTPEATGRGLITTAVRHMIDWAVQVRGMHRVEWRCAASNEPSRRVAERVGMTLEGTLRQAFLHNGERHDVEIWGLLATEWPSSR